MASPAHAPSRRGIVLIVMIIPGMMHIFFQKLQFITVRLAEGVTCAIADRPVCGAKQGVQGREGGQKQRLACLIRNGMRWLLPCSMLPCNECSLLRTKPWKIPSPYPFLPLSTKNPSPHWHPRFHHWWFTSLGWELPLWHSPCKSVCIPAECLWPPSPSYADMQPTLLSC